jgi:hypothetical protein
MSKKKIEVRWYGHNLERSREDLTRCIKAVWNSYGWGSHQCCRKRGHGPGGLYCKQHGKKAQARIKR